MPPWDQRPPCARRHPDEGTALESCVARGSAKSWHWSRPACRPAACGPGSPLLHETAVSRRWSVSASSLEQSRIILEDVLGFREALAGYRAALPDWRVQDSGQRLAVVTHGATGTKLRVRCIGSDPAKRAMGSGRQFHTIYRRMNRAA